MFDRLFRRGASAAAVCVNDEASTVALQDAQQRIAQLEMLLSAQVVELDAYRAMKAADKPAKVTTKKLAIVKPPKLGALDFWALHGQAVDQIRADFGDGWKVVAPIGGTELVALAACYRSAKTELGTTLRWSKDQRFPSAQYWPNGVFPEGVTVNGDYARDLQPARDAYAALRARVAHQIRERPAG